jgi:hypothetical protein
VGLIVRLWSFGVKLEGCLVELQRVFDLKLFRVVYFGFGYVVVFDVESYKSRLFACYQLIVPGVSKVLTMMGNVSGCARRNSSLKETVPCVISIPQQWHGLCLAGHKVSGVNRVMLET